MSQADVFYNRVEDRKGACSYVPQPVLTDLIKSGQASQWWRLLGQTVSVRLKSGAIVKRWDSLAYHASRGEEAFMSLIEECRAVDVTRPSSYSDIFHQRFYSPRIPHTVNALLSPGLAGAWQSALGIGYHRELLYKYDLNSAYLWSLLSHGLPDPATFRFVRGYSSKDGIFLLPSPGDKRLPYPFAVCNRWVLATQHELRAYSIDASRTAVYGITWSRYYAKDPLQEIIETCPGRKQVSQSYWGRWASHTTVDCHSQTKRWGLRNPIRNVVWAHCIISAVRLKVWRHAGKAVHVFVDSVITPETLEAGTRPGDWRLERVYPKGLLVFGPGMYGEPGCDLEKHAGVNLNAWEN